ncbi:MAG: helix-turn-helix transcriptional regulator [Acidobacteria bacterium]|nr:helix-turn-helix transcriptional regulator [Acidobacteriota bacterium]
MQPKEKKIIERPQVKRMVENIIRCKWSLSVLDMVKRGVNRPGAMERSVDGLTTKVLNERLRKLVRFGILQKTIYPEIPPRVEYEFTDFGLKFVRLLDTIEALETEIAN